MAKYKIQNDYLFTNKSFAEISDFLNNSEDTNLFQVRDKKRNTCLHYVAYMPCTPESIRLLKKYLSHMEKYCSKNYQKDPQAKFREFVNCENIDGLTPLHFASFKGHHKILQQLIRNGADHKKLTKSGQNVLHLAAQGRAIESFIFFQSLVDLNSIDNKRSTPLHWAAYQGSETIVAYLLSHPDVNVDVQDQQKQTPLHLSAAYGRTRILKKLLRAGANRHIKNSKNQTPLTIAKSNQYRNIMRILQDEYSCMDFVKIYLNLKTVYKPQKRSLKKPILFSLIFLLVTLATSLILIFDKNLFPFVWPQIGLALILSIIYLNLIMPPTKPRPHKLMDFLNGNINLKTICLACASPKPSRSFHCDVCQMCVARYDHHCFWVNNCIGKNNVKRFISFIVLFQLFLFYSLGISIYVIQYIFYQKPEQSQIIKAFTLFFCFGLAIFCFIFTFPMLSLQIVQLRNIFLNKTTYERFANEASTAFTDSTSHLLAEEILENKKTVRNCSFQNFSIMCSYKKQGESQTQSSSKLSE